MAADKKYILIENGHPMYQARTEEILLFADEYDAEEFWNEALAQGAIEGAAEGDKADIREYVPKKEDKIFMDDAIQGEYETECGRKVEIASKLITVWIDDEHYMDIPYSDEDAEKIIKGEDPVEEGWENGSGDLICEENATCDITDYEMEQAADSFYAGGWRHTDDDEDFVVQFGPCRDHIDRLKAALEEIWCRNGYTVICSTDNTEADYTACETWEEAMECFRRKARYICEEDREKYTDHAAGYMLYICKGRGDYELERDKNVYDISDYTFEEE